MSSSGRRHREKVAQELRNLIENQAKGATLNFKKCLTEIREKADIVSCVCAHDILNNLLLGEMYVLAKQNNAG
jgi:hypothetical protein